MEKIHLNLTKTSLNYDENGNGGYIREVDVKYPKHYMVYIMIYHFYQTEWKLINVINLYAICLIKTTMLFA